MEENLSSWVARFKHLDLKRSEIGLTPAEEKRWVELKDSIEH